MSDTKSRWVDFLNPDLVRTKFVAMGLFMVAHEMLLDAIKDRPLGFFSNEWTSEGELQQCDDYRREILARDPKGKGDALRGSLAWLREMEAIDEADIASVQEFTDARNVIAHELRNIIGGSTTPHFAGLFPRLIELVAKIDRWWVINVEIATDPDLAGQEIDEEGVTPGSLLIMQILGRVALGEDEEAWELYRAFTESERST
jgi:hypothetical protein